MLEQRDSSTWHAGTVGIRHAAAALLQNAAGYADLLVEWLKYEVTSATESRASFQWLVIAC